MLRETFLILAALLVTLCAIQASGAIDEFDINLVDWEKEWPLHTEHWDSESITIPDCNYMPTRFLGFRILTGYAPIGKRVMTFIVRFPELHDPNDIKAKPIVDHLNNTYGTPRIMVRTNWRGEAETIRTWNNGRLHVRLYPIPLSLNLAYTPVKYLTNTHFR